jgi:hypothetical protein
MNTTKNFADVIRKKLADDPVLAAQVEGERVLVQCAHCRRLVRKDTTKAGKNDSRLCYDHIACIEHRDRVDGDCP